VGIIGLTWLSVNTRNVCHLLNAVEACTVTEFKEAALEYICLNLETLLENRYASVSFLYLPFPFYIW
jgi:hypothetical protein